MPGAGTRRQVSKLPAMLGQVNSKYSIWKTLMTFEIHHPSWYKRQAASRKHQAASVKPEDLHAENTKSFKPQATEKNPKVRAPSSKPQASSRKRLDQ